MAAMAEAQSRAVMFRSREKEIDEGETCSRYFFRKVMARGALMKGLQAEDGVVVKDTEGMMRVVVEVVWSVGGGGKKGAPPTGMHWRHEGVGEGVVKLLFKKGEVKGNWILTLKDWGGEQLGKDN